MRSRGVSDFDAGRIPDCVQHKSLAPSHNGRSPDSVQMGGSRGCIPASRAGLSFAAQMH